MIQLTTPDDINALLALIPRSQRLTPESLLALMERIKAGEW